ncbi:hypothetical protein C2E20_3104 [Micractinium conductrix]|uniref:Uncharacterized protein n=1 Tax=Micractinium conductrix TaxID=554055 RepID=A0A2P6VHZ5_9CHLO|nr:hypothetical protein C2E20_3104 [Micractinium conductrix]|eukprot:PSC73698.1 hypothetical protein C2E20_3104 [Micractinium conductrix]
MRVHGTATEAAVFVTLDDGHTHRLPGPLALVQTGAASGGGHAITHVNGLSLAEIVDTCPALPDDGSEAWDAAPTSTPLTTVRRGTTTVRALTVVAVHAALLGGSGCSSGAAEQPADPAAAAAEQRGLLRAAARLSWGLAGVVYEVMHGSAGHRPNLGRVERQTLAGAVLTQLYRLDRNLALGVLRACGQLTPARLAEMLEAGLLPTPARVRAAAPAVVSPPSDEEACAAAAGTAPLTPRRRDAEEAAAQV